MKRLKKKIIFYKELLVEILETLCSICLYIESEGRRYGNPHVLPMKSHFNRLKDSSLILREELYGKH